MQVVAAPRPSDKILAKPPAVQDSERPQYPPGGRFMTTDITDELPIRYSKSGVGSKEEFEATTLPALFESAKRLHGDKIAMRVERPLPDWAPGQEIPPAFPDDKWKTWTYAQYYDESVQFAKALLHLECTTSDSVNIFGFNAPEWFISSMGASIAAVKPAGIYPTDTDDQIAYKGDHSNARVVCVGESLPGWWAGMQLVPLLDP